MESERIPAVAYPPGAYLRDEIEARDFTLKDFAKLIPMSEQKLIELLNGERKLILSVALRIAQLLGTSHEVWLNLESAWREYKRRNA